MENTLEALFDFLKFEGNSGLQQLIEESHARTLRSQNGCARRALSLAEANYVAAAGVFALPEEETPKHPIIIRSKDNSSHA